jgi:ubiquinone/menaquinone biosynthesis C-methylase UbiE
MTSFDNESLGTTEGKLASATSQAGGAPRWPSSVRYPDAPSIGKNAALEVVGLIPDPLRRRVFRLRNKIETLTTEAALDERLRKAAELFTESDDEARRYLRTFEFAPPPMPTDPFSDQYARAQWDLYRKIAQREKYEVSNEAALLDMPSVLKSPYPYSTGSAAQVADQLAACSFILRSLNPTRGMSLVEFGSGWGNLTLQFVMMGVDTTAVEVDANFAELLRQRSMGNVNLKVVVSDMLAFEPSSSRYDIAVFFESFHHCADHMAMLRKLKSVVTSQGVVAFAGEPISSFRYPWGLRLDGFSLFCTRTYGWLELGFDNRYFQEALQRTGWVAGRRRSRSMTPLADIITARQALGIL